MVYTSTPPPPPPPDPDPPTSPPDSPTHPPQWTGLHRGGSRSVKFNRWIEHAGTHNNHRQVVFPQPSFIVVRKSRSHAGLVMLSCMVQFHWHSQAVIETICSVRVPLPGSRSSRQQAMSLGVCCTSCDPKPIHTSIASPGRALWFMQPRVHMRD